MAAAELLAKAKAADMAAAKKGKGKRKGSKGSKKSDTKVGEER